MQASDCPHCSRLPGSPSPLRPHPNPRMLLEAGKDGGRDPHRQSWDIFSGNSRSQPGGHIRLLIAGHMVQGRRVTNLVFTSQRLDRTWATGRFGVRGLAPVPSSDSALSQGPAPLSRPCSPTCSAGRPGKAPGHRETCLSQAVQATVCSYVHSHGRLPRAANTVQEPYSAIPPDIKRT